MAEAVILAALASAVIALVAQVAAIGMKAESPRHTGCRLLLLAIWCVLMYLAVVELIRLNYCEANCPDDLNRPTAWLIAAVACIHASVLWLSYLGIPRIFRAV